jgi:hypothetical protein
LLIGKPGVGKSKAINAARDLIRATPAEGVYPSACNLAPVDVTKSALYDYLAQTKVRRSGPDPEAEMLGQTDRDYHYHSAFLAVSELSDLLRDHDTALLGALHGLFDCLPTIEEERRYKKDDPIKLQRPQISLLGGTTPAYLSRTFPQSAWDEGFMARSILIYSAEKQEPDLFPEAEDDSNPILGRELVEDLRQVGMLRGAFEWHSDAKKALVTWQKAGRQPAPNHIRLEHYNTRRMIHAIKLSMISAADKSNHTLITLEDFQCALEWMHEAELAMPQVFMEMSGKSDSQVMNELYHYVSQLFQTSVPKHRPVRRGLVVNFMRTKVPAWQVDKVIDMACDAELIQKSLGPGGDVVYKPYPKPMILKPEKKA